MSTYSLPRASLGTWEGVRLDATRALRQNFVAKARELHLAPLMSLHSVHGVLKRPKSHCMGA